MISLKEILFQQWWVFGLKQENGRQLAHILPYSLLDIKNSILTFKANIRLPLLNLISPTITASFNFQESISIAELAVQE